MADIEEGHVKYTLNAEVMLARITGKHFPMSFLSYAELGFTSKKTTWVLL